MAWYTAPVGKLKIRDGGNTAYHTIEGVNSNIASDTEAATQANKLFNIAGLSVVSDTNTTLTIEKKVTNDG